MIVRCCLRAGVSHRLKPRAKARPGHDDPNTLLLTGLQRAPLSEDLHAIQQSHPLSPSSPPVLNLSQHQGLFQ